MKKPLRLLTYSILTLALLAGLAFFLQPEHLFEGEEGEENEENESLPGVFLSMNEWSNMRTYPHKSMDELRFFEGHEQAKQMSIAARAAESKIYSTTTAPWVALAPKNFAGRVISLGFHPTDPNTMWCGSAAGGLWKTTSGGTGAPGGINWTYVSTGFPVLGVMSIAVHPTDGNTLYIGTGEVYNDGKVGGPTDGGYIRTFRGSYGIGILKTTDGGTNWTRVLNFDSSQLKGVADILIHPTNTNIVFAATTDGVYRSLNAGSNWTLIHNVRMAMDLCFKPGDPSVMYVASGNFNSAGRGIYKTTNSTSDPVLPTFTAINTGLQATITGKIALAVSAAAPSNVYASVGRQPDSNHPFGLYRSTNEGGSWTQIEDAVALMYPGSSRLNQGWYAHDVAVDPTNTNRIYWCEMDFWRSTDGGATAFARETQWNLWNINYTTVGGTLEGSSGNYAHADIHRIYVSPHNSNHVFVCTDGGVFRSTDNGQTFIGLNGGLQTAQIYPNMGLSRQDANFMIGGLQDNEGFIYNGSAGCPRIGNLGDGFHAAIHPTNDNICFIESYYLNIKKSTNRGGAWSDVQTTNSTVPPSENACFNAPFVMAPSSPSTLYAGTYRMRKSTSSGSSGTWNLIGPDPLVNVNALILYIAVAPNNANTLYVSVGPSATTSNKLMKSTDGAVSFTDVTGSLPDRYISDIAIDPANANRVAVTLSGFGTSHVYMTRDGGTTWTNVGGGLPDIPTNTLLWDPANRRTLYVGNDLGVFYAHGLPVGSGALPATTAVTWTAYNEGVENAVLVSDLLATHTGKLRMATFGRGLWERDFAPSSILPFVFKNFTASAEDNGNSLKWTVSTEDDVDRYEVEFGTDGTNFRKVGTQAATGGTGDISYNFLHRITNEMDGFYRIKIVSKDGSFEYSTVAVVKAQKLVTKLTVAPNPTTGMFKIRIPSDNTGAMNLQLFDATGKLLMVKRLEVLPGVKEMPVDISMFAAGTYQLTLEGYKARWTTRIIKR